MARLTSFAITAAALVTALPAPLALAYVSNDAPANHVFTGTTGYGVNFDGVTSIQADTNPDPELVGLGSGVLLSTGRHILTAAHVVTDGSGNITANGSNGNFVIFNTGGSPLAVPFASTDIAVHPNWNGNALHGFDLAIITLPTAVDPSITRYDIFRGGSSELNRQVVKAGYGQFGQGSATNIGGFFTLRAGLNEWEAQGLGAFGVSGITNDSTQLTYDFDNGLAANDAFGFFFGTTGPNGVFGDPTFNDAVGFGNDEVNAGEGDSGGPSFIFDDGVWKVAGITSYGLTLSFGGGLTSDVDSTLNSSNGEFAVDARIADPAMLAFIDSIIPEPTTGMMVLASTLLVAIRRRTA